jgi:hypothetical protein
MNSEEIWKRVPGFEERYEASTFGRIRSLDFSYISGQYSAHITKKGIINKLSLNNAGYNIVRMTKDGHRRTFIAHRVIAKTFIPNPDNKPQVNHINGIKTDNSVTNLEWSTCSENHKHAFKNGLNVARKVPRVGNAVIQMDLNGNVLAEYISTRYASQVTGICLSNLVNHLKGRLTRTKNFRWIYKPNVENVTFQTR